jgi:hypothetical protein
MFTVSLRTFSVRFVLIILTLAFAMWAGMTGIAGLYNFQANSFLELWNQQLSKNNTYQTTDDDYQTAVYASKRAIELTPYNGDYLTSAADIQMWQYRNNHALSPAQKSALKTEILDYYRTALKQRPLGHIPISILPSVKLFSVRLIRKCSKPYKPPIV